MNLLVTLVALGVFTAFTYRYLRESRISELIERYRPHGPISDIPESHYADTRRYLDPSAAKWHAESRQSEGIEGSSYQEPQRKAS